MNTEAIQEKCYPEVRFGGFSRVDGTIAFYSRVQALIAGKEVVVDVGCGRGVRLEDPCAYRRSLADLRAPYRTVIGLDVSASGNDNPMLDVFHQLEGGSSWPLESESADVIVSDFVLEHVTDPAIFFRETARILKPGGLLCARTPNKWGYVAFFARVLPSRLAPKLLPRLQAARKKEDVFPTVYLCNTPSAIRRYLGAVGMRSVVIATESEPNYFAFNRWLYTLAAAGHRLLPDRFKSTLFVFGAKDAH